MRDELKRFYDLVEDIEIAMLTTRRRDGHLESRAMALQKRASGADLWLVTAQETHKLQDIEADPHVNLAFYKDRTREWVSVSAIATLSRDRAKIGELYATDWKAWFGGDDPRHGTPDDPRIVLIGIDIHAVVYFEVDKPQPIVLFELAKGWFTGQHPDVGEVHRIEP